MSAEKKRQKPVNSTTGEAPIKSAHKKPFFIVGIGASAGGLEALEQFFKQMPADSGLAFVIVQHLDPHRHSDMPEILSKLTKMPVNLISDGMKLEADSIYLIPPDRIIRLEKSVLFVEKSAELRGLRLPIDFFLRS